MISATSWLELSGPFFSPPTDKESLQIWDPVELMSRIEERIQAVALQLAVLRHWKVAERSPVMVQSKEQHEWTRENKQKGKKSGKKMCVFCRQNAEWQAVKRGEVWDEDRPGDWKQHSLKDSEGNILCPVLSRYQCKHCGATGRRAHTDRYCPVEQQRKQERCRRKTEGGTARKRSVDSGIFEGDSFDHLLNH